jgi:hypothetical protein
MNHYVGIVISVILVMFSAILHEVAHGWVAYRCGDNTAKDAGRLTLNPLAHIDPFGSVILPIIMGIAGGPIFAFAKPSRTTPITCVTAVVTSSLSPWRAHVPTSCRPSSVQPSSRPRSDGTPRRSPRSPTTSATSSRAMST